MSKTDLSYQQSTQTLIGTKKKQLLDTETGEQVMHLLKEVAKDHLVIMVTHNPDLADRYATRKFTALFAPSSFPAF